MIKETISTITIKVSANELAHAKDAAITALSKDIKVPGFRVGKAPKGVLEKQISPNVLAEEVINHAVNDTYQKAIREQKLAPVGMPKITVTKFVPYSELEFTAEIEQVVVEKLANYKKLGVKKDVIAPSSREIEQVIDNMRTQMAERRDVERPVQSGDQAWIDFDGKDDKGEPVKGARSTNYPLTIGSNSFIPGFEDNILGMKAGEEKSFTLTFPKDYGVKALQSRKVTFDVKVVKVQELIKPELNDEFAKKVAPELTSVADLKKDIKAQLNVEAETRAKRDYENALVAKIVEGSEVLLPQQLIDEQVENVQRDLTQNLMYRGQTIQEYLDAIGMSAEEQREKELLPEAERRLKAGVLLSDIAEKESIIITPEELKARVDELKARYASDESLQKQLTDPAAQREVGAQLLTEKTVARIVELQ